ncbi:MAG: hypothetical protein HDT32_03915 [Clostridiales bacterium]|nr:hypothetical protein [Clostridiales bacterium]
MTYNNVREIANALKIKIDDQISKLITYEELTEFVKELMADPENRKRVYKVGGLAATIKTVLGARLPIFENILSEIEK